MQIEMMDINEINVAKYNPREIFPHQFTGLCESIKKFGLTQPLIVNKLTNTLVSGCQRLKAAEHLGFTQVPVTFVELSEAEEKALNITMNNKAIEGEFTEGLKDIIADIKISLGDDYIFDLNLEDTLKDLELPEIDEVVEDVEEKNENKKLFVRVEVENEDEQIALYQELTGRGFNAKVL